MPSEPTLSTVNARRTKRDAAGGGLRERARAISWVLRLTWGTSPGFLAGIVGVTLLRSVLPAALAWVAKELIDGVTGQLALETPNAGAVMPWLWCALGLAVVETLCGELRGYLSQRLADDLNLKVTTDILTHAADLDLAFFEDIGKQDSLQRAQQTTGNRFMMLITQTFGTISSALQVASLVLVLAVIQPWTWVVVVLFIPPFLIVRWTLARRHYELEYARTTKRRWTRYFVDLLTRHKTVAETRLLGLAPLLIRKYRTVATEFRDQNRGMYLANLRTSSFFAVISAAAFYGLLIELTLRALGGAATLGDVAVFFAASARLREGIQSGVGSLTGLFQDSLHVSALMEFFESRSSAGGGGAPVPRSSAGAISVENVDFTYPGSSEPVLRGLSMEIHPGETVAVVGENGCGKTTLVKLIARLYSPDRGRITLDGRDLEELEARSLHRQIAFIFQHFSRYEGTAADNIAYGDWENCLDKPERIEQIARSAGVHDMLAAMPEGYDTMLGRSFGSFDLSGGQWQRLAVARAFARSSSLLILDEPTASLDARAEYELFGRARELARGKTTILISHRFSTVSMADRIVVMDEGRVVEQGTHRELLAAAGQYAKLYRLHERQMEPEPQEALHAHT